jgi:hypothetical protein
LPTVTVHAVKKSRFCEHSEGVRTQNAEEAVGVSLYSLVYVSLYPGLNPHRIVYYLFQGKSRVNWVRTLSLEELSFHTLCLVLPYDLILFCVLEL